MGDHQRSTRGCPPHDLRPELGAAIRAHAERHGLGDVEAAALACCETTSVRTKRAGLFQRLVSGAAATVYSAVLVTPSHLVWAVGDDGVTAGAISGRLEQLEIRDYAETEMASIMADTGLEVRGITSHDSHIVTAFLPLDDGPDADHLRVVVAEAQRAARGGAGEARRDPAG